MQLGNNLENIKVGDKVIIRGNTAFSTTIAEVTKVNKSTFVAGHYTFKKQSGSQYGGDTWSRVYASLATEEDIAKVTAEAERRRIVYTLRSFDFYKLSDEDLKKIYSIVKKGQ